MNLKELTVKLSDLPANEAKKAAAEYLSTFSKAEINKAGNVTGFIDRQSEYTILLDAHIDEICFRVTDIDEKGFVHVTKSGGIDLRVLAASPVMIWGNEPVFGVFCSVAPHLMGSDKDDTAAPLDKMFIDCGRTGDEMKKLVSVGDIVTFHRPCRELLNRRITGKALDDRSGCAVIIKAAERLAAVKNLPVNVAVLLSDCEETTGTGADVAGNDIFPDEAIICDVSFADYPGVNENDCGKLGGGPLIGIAPVIDKKISDKLKETAEKNEIPFQLEVMGGRTGTNLEKLLVSRSGVRCGLVSVPQRNMHTPAEIVDVNDLEAVCDLIFKYVTAGGEKNV